MTPADYLRDLAERLMHVPVMHGTDQGDVDRLTSLARDIDTVVAIAEESTTANSLPHIGKLLHTDLDA